MHTSATNCALLLLTTLGALPLGCDIRRDDVRSRHPDEETTRSIDASATTETGASVVSAVPSQDTTSPSGAALGCHIDYNLQLVGSMFTCPDFCNTCTCGDMGISWLTHDVCSEFAVPNGCPDVGKLEGEVWECEGGCSTCQCAAGTVVTVFKECDTRRVCEGEFTIRNQEQLDALAGCQEVTQHLYIVVDLDLEPLRHLERVGGRLSLSNGQDNAPGFASLAGLRSLKSTGALWLSNVLVSDLSELEALTEVGGTESAGLEISNGSPNIRSLSGLPPLQRLDTLHLWNLPNLESLDGSVLPAKTSVSLGSLPSLKSVTALAAVKDFDTLAVTDCDALEVLDLGSQPERLSSLSVESNQILREVRGLTEIDNIDSLYVRDNPELVELTLPRLLTVGSTLWVSGNETLDALELSAVESAGRVIVIFNPSLETPTIETLVAPWKTTSTKVARNKNDPLGVRDPCPWLNDRQCDASLGLCEEDSPDCNRLN